MDLRKRVAKYLASPRGDLISSNREELSYSRMSTMIRNPREHYLKYEKHLRYYREKSSLFFGKIMHEVLAYFYTMEMKPDLKDLQEYFISTYNAFESNSEYAVEYSKTELLQGFKRKELPEMEARLNTDKAFELERYMVATQNAQELGLLMLETWYNTYAQDDRENTETLAIEAPFWIPLITPSGRINQRYMISGIIDRVYRDLRTGKIVVQDHKNLARKMSASTPDTATQISVYILGAVYLGYHVEDACYNILYKTKKPTVERLFTTRTNEQLEDMKFGMRVVKFVKSNGIAVVKNKQTCGIGPGQVNRIWATKQCFEHADTLIGEDATKGAVLASDAFFPFSDCVEAAHEAGITAIIQPGGSVRDQESIDKCDEYGIAMVFTGMRHFKH